MSLFDVFLLGLALAVDAFAVSFSYGLSLKPHHLENGLKLGLATGLGQFIMPLIGWYGAGSISLYIESIDHWLAFFVFLALGLKVINDALHNDGQAENLASRLTLQVLVMIGIATSIDALVTGATLYFVNTPIWSAAVIIGLTSFVCATLGYQLCLCFRHFPTRWLEIGSGIILIALGAKVLVEHLSA